MQVQLAPDAIILSLFDEDGNYTGPAERCIVHQGQVINIDDYATQVGLTLPDSE